MRKKCHLEYFEINTAAYAYMEQNNNNPLPRLCENLLQFMASISINNTFMLARLQYPENGKSTNNVHRNSRMRNSGLTNCRVCVVVMFSHLFIRPMTKLFEQMCVK